MSIGEVSLGALLVKFAWVPITGLLAYFLRKRDKQIDDNEEQINQLSEKVLIQETTINNHSTTLNDFSVMKEKVIGLEVNMGNMAKDQKTIKDTTKEITEVLYELKGSISAINRRD